MDLNFLIFKMRVLEKIIKSHLGLWLSDSLLIVFLWFISTPYLYPHLWEWTPNNVYLVLFLKKHIYPWDMRHVSRSICVYTHAHAHVISFYYNLKSLFQVLLLLISHWPWASYQCAQLPHLLLLGPPLFIWKRVLNIEMLMNAMS